MQTGGRVHAPDNDVPFPLHPLGTIRSVGGFQVSTTAYGAAAVERDVVRIARAADNADFHDEHDLVVAATDAVAGGAAYVDGVRSAVGEQVVRSTLLFVAGNGAVRSVA